jgi:hypothetical protein
MTGAGPGEVIAGRVAFALVHGDCLDPAIGLPSLPDRIERSHVITDPPYSEHVHTAKRTIRASDGCPRTHDFGFEALTDDVLDGLLAQTGRTLARWCLFFCTAEHLGIYQDGINAAGMEYIRAGAWVKLEPMPQISGDRPAIGFESIAIGHATGRKKWNGGGLPALWSERIVKTDTQAEHRVHPAQKPLALMEKLVRLFTDPGDLVIDPFAGSGTTGVACIRLGRRFIGWERDEKHHATALKRLQATREQRELFGANGDAKKKPGQPSLFGAGQ